MIRVLEDKVALQGNKMLPTHSHSVIYFAIEWHIDISCVGCDCREHDKGPDQFCSVLVKLLDEEMDFRVSILGSHTNDIPSKDSQVSIYFYVYSRFKIIL